MKKFLTFIVAIVLTLGIMPVHRLVAEDVSGSKKANKTILTAKDNEVDVTLTLPSAEYHYKYDIVFVMDSSSSTFNNDVDFATYVNELWQEVSEKEAILNVGVIKCRGYAFDTIALATDNAYSGLVEYSDETKDAIDAGIGVTEAELKALSSGTNMHGGLDLANEWLEADTEVEDDHKFVILLMDGKTYIWNNEANEPTTYYTQYQNSSGVKGVPAIGQTTGAYTKSAYKHKDNYYYNDMTDPTKMFYFADFADLYSVDNAEIASTETDYDYYCVYADKQGTAAAGNLTQYPTTNGSSFTYNYAKNYYKFDLAEGWEDLHYLQTAPYLASDNGDGTYTYDLEQPNPDFLQVHPDSLQKGLYLTAHLWTDMNTKYNTAAIIYSDWKGGSGLEIAKSFCNWVKGADISDYAADITNTTQVSAIFDSIKDEILYMVKTGVVTDLIQDQFTLVDNGIATFTMTRSGETLTATAGDDENSWNFGTADDSGAYPYSVVYYPDANSFDWIIRVPVENANPITLTYTLAIDTDSDAGFYDTNKSAVLDYKTSTGEPGTYVFEIPQVEFKTITPAVTENDPPVKKVISGPVPAGAEFEFMFEAVSNTAGLDTMPMPEAAGDEQFMVLSVEGAGETEIGTMTFTEEGVYTYEISEIVGRIAGCTYDDSVYQVIYTITYNKETYALESERVITKDGEDSDVTEFEFVNTFKVPDPTPDPDGTPNTGDNSHTVLWAGLMIFSAISLAVILTTGFKLKKR